MYAPMSSGDFQLIRQTLLIFFQDMHIRVSRQDAQTGGSVKCIQKVVSHCAVVSRAFSVYQVSIFLKDKVQNSNGRFVLSTSGPVPYGTQVPGTIR